jgi:O-antigen ligase
MFYINSDSNKVFLKKLLPLVLVLLVTFPLWKGALSGLQEKQQKNVEMMGGTSGSRDEKWSNRLEEFNQSPIWGMGFSACDPQNDEDYMRSTGTIEPGSSWLAVLSMTGLIGFIPFVIMACKAGCKVWKYRKVNQRAPLYIGLIAFLFTHMLVEGYILAGGSVFCFVSWLIIASCYDLCD